MPELPANAQAKRNARANARSNAQNNDNDALALIESWLDGEGLDIGDSILIENIDEELIKDIKRICAADTSRSNRILRITTSGDDMTVQYLGGV
jgi:hypothetical protein